MNNYCTDIIHVQIVYTFQLFFTKDPWFIRYLPKINKLISEGLERAGGVVIIDLEIWIIDEYINFILSISGYQQDHLLLLYPTFQLGQWREKKQRGELPLQRYIGEVAMPQKMLLFVWFLLCPSTVSLNLQRQTL